MPRRKAPSRKSPHMVYCESSQEDEALMRFEACPSVISVRSQSKTVTFAEGRRSRRSTPDFELGLANGRTVLVEVKNSQQAKRPEIAEKLSAVKKAAERLGYPYHVVTERWIRFEPVLENLRILARWRSTATITAYSPLLDDLRCDLPLPFHQVAKRIGGRAKVAGNVLANRLHMNLLAPISESSMVLAEPHVATQVVLDLPWQSIQGRAIWGGEQ